MVEDFSYGIIPVFKQDNGFWFLLVKHAKGDHWSFPKGHKEKGEDDLQAAKRELLEETGIGNIDIVQENRIFESYLMPDTQVEKKVTFYIGNVKNKYDTNPNDEIAEARWCDFNQAFDLLTYPDTRIVLKKAYWYLKFKDSIIFEDDVLLVVDKPAGLRVDHDPDENISIEDYVDNNLERKGIVHRLDKNTSGVMIVAKTIEAYEDLQLQFKNHDVKKIYLSLVLGNSQDSGTINSDIARDPKRKQAMKVVHFNTGLERGKLRTAITHYKTIGRYIYDHQLLSLLEVKIDTGRTHQIRVHLQSIGYPIIGDQMYNSKVSKKISTKLDLTRQFLHSSQLEFMHPVTNKLSLHKSSLPPELNEVLAKLSDVES